MDLRKRRLQLPADTKSVAMGTLECAAKAFGSSEPRNWYRKEAVHAQAARPLGHSVYMTGGPHCVTNADQKVVDDVKAAILEETEAEETKATRLINAAADGYATVYDQFLQDIAEARSKAMGRCLALGRTLDA